MSPECNARHHRGEVRANAVRGDKVLSAVSGKGKAFVQAASTLIA